MTKTVNQAHQETVFNDIDDAERTMNYIRFQIRSAEVVIEDLSAQGKHVSCYAHLLDWRRKLLTELNDMRKAQKRNK